MAVAVPNTVEISVDNNAMVIDTDTALMISASANSSWYHLSEKPVNLVNDLDELKEKNIVTKIGRYKNRKQTVI